MSTLDAALGYASEGWRVVPILPGSKRPAITRWTEQATTDAETIRHWWEGHDDYGVGITTGSQSGFWVLDVDDFDSLRDLEQRYEVLPDTRTSITGSGGYHFLFRWPTDGRDIRNDAGRRLGPGLDIRGEGGQIVAPPSVHPNGTTYQWDAGMGDDIAAAPEWLLDLVCVTDEVEQRERSASPSSDRPGDLWAAATTWDDLLTRDGWTLHHVDRSGEHHWTRPGKERRDGTSATTEYKGSDILKMFTSSMRAAGLDEEQTYTKLGYLASTRFDGDHSAAAASLVAAGWGTHGDDPFNSEAWRDSTEALVKRTLDQLPPLVVHDDDAGTDEHWRFIDLGPIIDGDYDPPTPTQMRRSDGIGLLYPGRVHSIAGEPGGGKTWLALHFLAEVIDAGGVAMMIDYEDSPQSAVSRLLALGVDRCDLRERFHYVKPEGPLIDRKGRVATSVLAKLDAIAADGVVIDSIGESLATEGLKPNDDDDVTVWFRRIARRLARNGATVLGVDHQAKDKDQRGLWAIGSQRKLAAIDGAAYVTETKQAPTTSSDGRLNIMCAKDRHGTHQRGQFVGAAIIANIDGGGVSITIAAPDAEFRPTHLMERVSRFLEESPTSGTRAILAAVSGHDKHLRAALDALRSEGYVRRETGGRGGHQWSSIEPFREPDETANLRPRPPRPNRGHDHLAAVAVEISSGDRGHDHFEPENATAATPRPPESPEIRTAATAAKPRPNENGRGAPPTAATAATALHMHGRGGARVGGVDAVTAATDRGHENEDVSRPVDNSPPDIDPFAESSLEEDAAFLARTDYATEAT